MENKFDYEKVLIKEVQKLKLRTASINHKIDELEAILSRQNEEKLIQYQRLNKEGRIKARGSCINHTQKNTKPRDVQGKLIEIGDSVKCIKRTKFNTSGGVVTKLTNTTVTAYDEDKDISTWKLHKNCEVIER